MNFLLAASDLSAPRLHGIGVFNYWLVIALMMTGLFLILSKSNMVKTIIGLNFFQVSVIMFYVSMGKVDQGTAPILFKGDVPSHSADHDEHGSQNHQDQEHGSLLQNKQEVFLAATAGGQTTSKNQATTNNAKTAQAATKDKSKTSFVQSKSGILYSNPLPHVLMLTAIVVGVATTALALSLVVRINEAYGTIEENELEEKGALS
jgi:multicomponent Na+:H+ antiporter subunit C